MTHSRVFGSGVHPTKIQEILSDYPLAAVLRTFTRILHIVEQGGDRLAAERMVLKYVGIPDTIKRVEAEVESLAGRGSSPRIFPEITLLNFLKLALRFCPIGDRDISALDVDLLVRCYLATHDHFPPERTSRSSGEGKKFMEWLEQDLIRQSMRLDEPMELLIPRYWALWVTFPRLLGKEEALRTFIPPSAPQDIRKGFIVALSLWAYWNSRAQDLAAPVMLRRRYWDGHPQVWEDVDAWLREIALPAEDFKRELEREWTRLGREEVWEYSFVTMQNWPLVWIGDDLYCLSLKGLIRRVTDGVYYRMLTACAGDAKRVNDLTRLFGDFFHEYVHDLWQRTAGKTAVRRVRYGKLQKEAGDGFVERGSDFLLYDAKSTRFRLPTVRTGKIDDVASDLQRGILEAARQLDSVILDIRAGQVQGGVAFRQLHLLSRGNHGNTVPRHPSSLPPD